MKVYKPRTPAELKAIQDQVWMAVQALPDLSPEERQKVLGQATDVAVRGHIAVPYENIANFIRSKRNTTVTRPVYVSGKCAGSAW